MRKLLTLFVFIIPYFGFGQCDSFDGTLSVSTTGHTVSAGYSQQFVCVNNSGTILSINSTGNFTGLADGNYTIYAVNYEGSAPISLGVGLPWSNVDLYDQDPSNCFHSINNNYSVCSTEQVCNGGNISVTTSNHTSTAGYQQIYVLVDVASGNILDANNTGTFSQSSYFGLGNYEVYAVNTNDSGLSTLLSGNGSWNSALTAISSSCADFIGPKLFDVINCCDINVSASANDETCSGNDGSIDLTISGTGTYDVLLNGTSYNPLNDVTANTYSITNLSNGTYEIIVFDINTSTCDDTVTISILEGGSIYNSIENLSACLNSTVTYPDGSTELITGNTSHTSNLTTIGFGCDSIIVTNITATNAVTNTINETVCFGAQFTSPQGNNYSTGSFDETYVSAAGCDSTVTFIVTEVAAITNTVNETVCFGAQFTSPQGNNYSTGSFDETYNSAAGCDSIVTFIVTELNQITNSINETICIGSQFTSPQGNNYSAGSFDETYVSAAGCDSIVTFVISEVTAITNSVNETVCFGDQFTSPQGNNYSTGSFDETYNSATGCDSIVTFIVTELNQITNSVNETICAGSQFTSPQGNNYSVGSFDETYVSAAGCDSMVTFIVTEVAAITNTVNETVCFGAQFTSPQGNNYSTGSFDETYNSAAGCDSIVTFIISEETAITNSVNETVCFGDQFTSPQGNNYNVGSFNETYISSSGCDSIVTFVISELTAITNIVNETVCFGAIFTSPQGNNYSAGSFDETYISASGCDSIVTFIVTELAAITSSQNETVCFGSNYVSSQGIAYSPGTYTEVLTSFNGCDSLVTLTITELEEVIADFTYSSSSGTSINSEIQFTNMSSGAHDFTWNFGDQTQNSFDESPLHQFPAFESDEYTITLVAINSFGCTDTSILVLLIQDELIFYIPNAFSPDGDQFNQTFSPVFSSGYDPYNFTMQIFNRWGEIIFETANPMIGWDGTYQGKYCQVGTYTWKIQLKVVNNDEKQIHVGHVNIIK